MTHEEKLQSLTKDELITRILKVVNRNNTKPEPTSDYQTGSFNESCEIVRILVR